MELLNNSTMSNNESIESIFFIFEAAAKVEQQQEQQSKRVRFQESGAAAENGLDVTDNGESVTAATLIVLC